MKPIRVAVADDSSFIRLALARLLGQEPNIEVVGLASSGEELLEHLAAWQPEAIVLDLAMPGMGGLGTLDALRARPPVPVLILSTHSSHGAPQTIEALHRGAVDFIDKQQYSLVDFEALRAVLVEKLRQMTAVHGGESRALPYPGGLAALGAAPASPGAIDLLVVGASAGGPPAIEQILADLGELVAVPIAIVQHMPAAFTRSFAERLNTYLPLRVQEAVHHEPLRPGFVYIAPGGQHLRIESDRDGLRAALSLTPEGAAHRPAVDVLFASAGVATRGRLAAVLLTGMGSDGAASMAALAQSGVHTIAQDRASSVVFGMPRAAIEAGGAREVLSLERIGPRLLELLSASGPKPWPAAG